MSRYTVELRKIEDVYGHDELVKWFTDYELSDYLMPDEIEVINQRGTWTKEKLARKIIDHYYMREIAFETPTLFKLKAKVAMQEIMEEKLPLIYSIAIKYDPLINVDYTESYDGSNTGNSQSQSSNKGSGLSVNSDTPQGQISKDKILEGTYASSTAGSENESSINDNSSSNGTQQYTKRIRGNSGVSATAQAMVKQYRQNIVMVDRDIIEDLSTLFMAIY